MWASWERNTSRIWTYLSPDFSYLRKFVSNLRRIAAKLQRRWAANECYLLCIVNLFVFLRCILCYCRSRGICGLILIKTRKVSLVIQLYCMQCISGSPWWSDSFSSRTCSARSEPVQVELTVCRCDSTRRSCTGCWSEIYLPVRLTVSAPVLRENVILSMLFKYCIAHNIA